MNTQLAAIRDRVASGEFTRAHRLWDEYAACLAEQARLGDLPEQVLEETAQLVEWTKVAALMARAHAVEEIARRRADCRVARAYSGNSAGRP
jgi:hypothetical protein